MSDLITFVCCPKPFLPEYKIIQTNAILSWKRLKSCGKIVVCCNDEGIAEFCKDNQLIHEPTVKVNEWKTPLLDSIFELGKKHTDKYMCYINSDIFLLDDFDDTFQAIKKLNMDKFLTIGRRWDFYNFYEVLFDTPDWKEKLLEATSKSATLRDTSSVDYFLFTPSTYGYVHPFAIGRYHWDRWLVYEAMRQNYATIDASNTIYPIHQVSQWFQYQKPVANIDNNSEEVRKNLNDFGWFMNYGKNIDDSSHLCVKNNGNIEIVKRPSQTPN